MEPVQTAKLKLTTTERYSSRGLKRGTGDVGVLLAGRPLAQRRELYLF